LPELFSACAVENAGRAAVTAIRLRSPAGFHILQLVDRRGVGAEAAVKADALPPISWLRTNEAVSESEARRKLADLREPGRQRRADLASWRASTPTTARPARARRCSTGVLPRRYRAEFETRLRRS